MKNYLNLGRTSILLKAWKQGIKEYRNDHYPTYRTLFKANLKGCTNKVGNLTLNIQYSYSISSKVQEYFQYVYLQNESIIHHLFANDYCQIDNDYK